TPDIDNLLPHMMRVLMYASGVIFSVDRYLGQFSWGWIMEYQPVAVYLHLVRSSILNEPAYPPDAFMWLLGGIWAGLFGVIGFRFCWAGEEQYGRHCRRRGRLRGGRGRARRPPGARGPERAALPPGERSARLLPGLRRQEGRARPRTRLGRARPPGAPRR